MYARTPNITSMELLLGLKKRLDKWGEVVTHFLKDRDDEVELLLTFEEMCQEEGVFQNSGGSAYVQVFQHTLKMLYDCDVLSEEGILSWADQKKNACKEDRRFV